MAKKFLVATLLAIQIICLLQLINFNLTPVCLASEEKPAKSVIGSILNTATSPDSSEKIFDDETHYVKAGASPKEMLEARGYIGQEFHFITKDGYKIAVTRGLNPLINKGKSGYKSKLPILFVHGATVTATSYLLNSRFVRPRVYDESYDLSGMNSEQLLQLVADDPARFSLPFLALNFGYEVYLMERRGFAGSRSKLGHESRTVADAFKAIPTTLIGNSMDGFSLDANMARERPRRMRYTRDIWSRAPQSARRSTSRRKTTLPNSHFSAEEFGPKPKAGRDERLDEFKPKSDTGRLIKRMLKNTIRKRLGPLKHINMLQALFSLAKLPSTFATLVGNITHEFIDTFDPEFWRFSLDEQVEHDFPGAVDLVLEKSGARKVHAVGLSCGGALILLGLAEWPELSEKISRAVLWAPSVNMGSKTDIVYLLGYLIPLVQGYVGPLPFVFLTPVIEVLLQVLCSSEFMQRTVCAGALDVLMGHSGTEAPVRPHILGHVLQPTSSGELFHLGQFARTQFPCKFNLNSKEENMRKYGQERAPCYDLGQITLHNISFYGGAKDRMVSPDDIATTVTQMNVPAEMHIIKGPNVNFNHLGCFLHERNDRLIILPSLLDMERSQAAELRHPHGSSQLKPQHGSIHSTFENNQFLDNADHLHHHGQNFDSLHDQLDGRELEHKLGHEIRFEGDNHIGHRTDHSQQFRRHVRPQASHSSSRSIQFFDSVNLIDLTSINGESDFDSGLDDSDSDGEYIEIVDEDLIVERTEL